MRIAISDHATVGDAIAARASSLAPAPRKALRAPLGAFLEAHRALSRAQGEVDDARAARDEALAAVAHADEVLDAKVEALADALVGAGLGSRKNPFAAFGPRAPSELTKLGYAHEVRAARALAAAVAKEGAAPKKALAELTRAAAAVERALGGVTKPQHRYQRALAARDALLLDWQKQLSRLKKIAVGALVDDDAAYRALFAAPHAEQAPRARKRATAHPRGMSSARTAEASMSSARATSS